MTARTRATEPSTRSDHRVGSLVGRKLADVERDLIAATLARCGGNRAWAADILGITALELRERLLMHEARREGRLSKSEAVDRLTRMLTSYDPGRARPS